MQEEVLISYTDVDKDFQISLLTIPIQIGTIITSVLEEKGKPRKISYHLIVDIQHSIAPDNRPRRIITWFEWGSTPTGIKFSYRFGETPDFHNYKDNSHRYVIVQPNGRI